MQDDFNSAPTPAGLPTPMRPAPPPGHAPQGAPQPRQPGIARPADQTITYHGPIDVDQPTVANPPLPAWPAAGQAARQGAATPYAPTVRQPQPSGPPIYQPPGYAPAPPGYAPAPIPPGYAPAPPGLPAPAPQPAPQPAPRPVPRSSAPRRSAQPRAATSYQAPTGRRATWIPLPHALLVIGVALLYVATLLPWAVDQNGSLITLQGATIPALSAQNGGSALQIAYDLLGAVGVLSAGLLFFNIVLRGLNRLLGGGCLAGCAVAPFYPILLALIGALVVAQIAAAGFGGLGALGQIPVVQSYGLGGLGVAHYEPGYYVWYTGLILNVAGMLGEFVVWRG